MPWQKYLRDALILWATIDPVSTLVIFMALTRKETPPARRKIALRTVLYAGAILLGAAVAGQFILIGMGISMLAFQIAGGIVLFLFALQLIFQDLAASKNGDGAGPRDPAVYPLAFPSIATPGAILAMVVLTDNHLYSIEAQVGTVAIAIVVLVITYLAIRSGERVMRVLGEPGAELLVRLMGLLLAALSIQLIYDAITLPLG